MLRASYAIPGLLLLAAPAAPFAEPPAARVFEIWDGDRQRVGHLGDTQDDYNLRGHIARWRDVDQVMWSRAARPQAVTPVSFRAYRRLAQDGDFNVDVPIGQLDPGENVIVLKASFRDGRSAEERVTLVKETGARPLPVQIRWRELRSPLDAGQAVDGRWIVENGRLRTATIGYDRIFLIGTREWQDYEVRTSVIVHRVAAPEEAPPYSGGNGLGLILRFAGHTTGGPFHFPSGQPKWGYLPLGGITWLRWSRGQPDVPPIQQFISGDQRLARFGDFPVRIGTGYEIRARCETLADAPGGESVTRYRFRIWASGAPEPAPWACDYVLTSTTALRKGGLALLAHHIDASFGDLVVTPLPAAAQRARPGE